MALTRIKLHKLQKAGSFVFHGTAIKVKILKPSRAYNYVKGVRVEEDKPAIYATPFADLAIFMAVVNRKNCPKNFRSGFSYKDNKLSFRATKITLNQLNNKSSGYVYIFDKKDFIKKNPCEHVVYKKIKPVKVVKVTTKDLPGRISIIKINKSRVIS